MNTTNPKDEGKAPEHLEASEVELTLLALEGLASGEPMDVGPDYWKKKHQLLDERLLQRTIE